MSRKAYYKSGGDLVLEEPCPSCPIDFKYNYKYNGKEYQDELGLNFYDYGARNYDPALGRWMNMDPLAYKYFSYSSYNYALNVPTFFIDPDGKKIIWGEGDADKKTREQVEELRKNSASFNVLYEFLDGLEDYDITISIDDAHIDVLAKKNNIDEDSAQGVFDPESNTIYYREGTSDTTVGEELFHALQKYINKRDSNQQNISDMEAEAKLFNYDVSDEKRLSKDPGSILGVILDSSQMELYSVKDSQDATGNTKIENGENKEVYDGYVKSFYEFYNSSYGNKHPYSKKAPLYNKPATYNEVQDLKKNK